MRIVIILIIFFHINMAHADKGWLCIGDACGDDNDRGTRSSSAPAQPTTNSSISINPAAVPTNDIAGIETIYYRGLFDFALVKGLGRIGAAISPSNSDETFFGAPAFEYDDEFKERKDESKKLPSQKLTFATAFNLYENKKKGLKRFELNLGVIGRYNKISSAVSGGGGLNGIAGPFTFGYSAYSDTFVQSEAAYKVDESTQIKYTVETFSAGIFLESAALDYSLLRVYALGDTANVAVTTASLFIKKAIFTASYRQELSDRPYYDFRTGLLSTQRQKNETFGGIQVVVSKHILVGMFYNYYLLHEYSLGATAFF